MTLKPGMRVERPSDGVRGQIVAVWSYTVDVEWDTGETTRDIRPGTLVLLHG